MSDINYQFDRNIGEHMDDYVKRISRTVSILREWRALEYTGHLIDVNKSMMSRIRKTSARTQEVLTEWGFEEIP